MCDGMHEAVADQQANNVLPRIDKQKRMARLSDAPSCSRCGRACASGGFRIDHGVERGLACLRCAIGNGRLLRRSLRIAVIVGTVLVAINHGNVIMAGVWHESLSWKVPLTYAVPFTVAMWSALSNLRARRPPDV